MNIIPQTRRIEFHIAYDGDGEQHFLTRKENGRFVQMSVPISEAEAREIMSIDGRPDVESSRRNVGNGWSWMATRITEVQ